MRLVVGVLSAVLLTAACGGRSTAGPAWPKQTDKEVDGGESLEPRTASTVAAVEDDAPAVEAKPAEKPAETPAAAEVKPSTPTPTPPPEEPVTTEEIVIEVED